jgi:hypothetical protein
MAPTVSRASRPPLQVDYMQESTNGITYTPTFAVYKKGRKVRPASLP